MRRTASTVISTLVAILLLAQPAPVRATLVSGHALHVTSNGWDLYYQHINGDGLNIYSAFFNGRKAFADYRVPHVWIDYINFDNITDNFIDAVWQGCTNAPVSGGFRLYCDYKFGGWSGSSQVCGTYYYRDSVWFYDNGVFQPDLIVYGPGFQYSKYYEPRFRIDFDINSSSPNYFYRWDSSIWTKKTVEGNYYDDLLNRDGYESGYEWRVRDSSDIGRSYYIDPSHADAKPGSGRGADMYVTRYVAGETEPESDDTPLSPFLNGQSIDGADVVTWNVAFTPLQAACVYGDPLPPLRSMGFDSAAPSGY